MSRELVERLRTRKTVAQWTRGVDADYPAIWSPDRDCHEAATLLEQQAAEIERLRAELTAEQARADMHADLGRRTAEALGIKPGDGRSKLPELAEALRKDAERYRWLRNGEWEPFTDAWLCEQDVYGQGSAELDAAIDAARERAAMSGGKS